MKAVFLALGAIAPLALFARQPIITSVVNAASFQPGIEAGSWVAITGTNLSNVSNQWGAAGFNGSMLPRHPTATPARSPWW